MNARAQGNGNDSDPGDREEDGKQNDLTVEQIIEWLSRDPQAPGSSEFRERVMREIRDQPNVHRKAFCTRDSRGGLICSGGFLRSIIIFLLGIATGVASSFVLMA